MLLWNIETEELKEITLIKNKKNLSELQELYKHLNCDTIDITTRIINKIRYDIIVNDNGLLLDNYIWSYFEDGQQQLAGNLIFSKADAEGENIGLNKEQIDNLKENLQIVYYRNNANEEIKALHYTREV